MISACLALVFISGLGHATPAKLVQREMTALRDLARQSLVGEPGLPPERSVEHMDDVISRMIRRLVMAEKIVATSQEMYEDLVLIRSRLGLPAALKAEQRHGTRKDQVRERVRTLLATADELDKKRSANSSWRFDAAGQIITEIGEQNLAELSIELLNTGKVPAPDAIQSLTQKIEDFLRYVDGERPRAMLNNIAIALEMAAADASVDEFREHLAEAYARYFDIVDALGQNGPGCALSLLSGD